jgi:hypothetical protein
MIAEADDAELVVVLVRERRSCQAAGSSERLARTGAHWRREPGGLTCLCRGTHSVELADVRLMSRGRGEGNRRSDTLDT